MDKIYLVCREEAVEEDFGGFQYHEIPVKAFTHHEDAEKFLHKQKWDGVIKVIPFE